MTLDQLASFVFSASFCSFSQAAKAMYISRSAVCKRISALERELEVELFERSTHEVRLTEAGALIFNDCTQILTQVDALRVKLKNRHDDDLSENNRLELLCYSKPFFCNVATALDDIVRDENVGVSLRLHVLRNEVVEDIILSQQAAVALVYSYELTQQLHLFDTCRIATDHFCLVFESGHWLGRKKQWYFDELAPHITDESIVVPDKAPPTTGKPFDSPQELLRFAEEINRMHKNTPIDFSGSNKDKFIILPYNVAKSGASKYNICQLYEFRNSIEMVLCWLKESNGPALRSFLACMRDSSVLRDSLR